VETPLNHREAQGLFLDALDGALPPNDSARLNTHLGDCVSCREGYQAYSNVVHRVRSARREKAPEGLASLVLRRMRRNRFSSPRHVAYTQAHFRLPVELIVPLLIAAGAVVWLLLAAL
jgi:anti-sigma factor RsiW